MISNKKETKEKNCFHKLIDDLEKIEQKFKDKKKTVEYVLFSKERDTATKEEKAEWLEKANNIAQELVTLISEFDNLEELKKAFKETEKHKQKKKFNVPERIGYLIFSPENRSLRPIYGKIWESILNKLSLKTVASDYPNAYDYTYAPSQERKDYPNGLDSLLDGLAEKLKELSIEDQVKILSEKGSFSSGYKAQQLARLSKSNIWKTVATLLLDKKSKKLENILNYARPTSLKNSGWGYEERSYDYIRQKLTDTLISLAKTQEDPVTFLQKTIDKEKALPIFQVISKPFQDLIYIQETLNFLKKKRPQCMEQIKAEIQKYMKVTISKAKPKQTRKKTKNKKRPTIERPEIELPEISTKNNFGQ